jgi:hypothetical protein
MQMKKYLYKPSIFSSYVFNIAKPSCWIYMAALAHGYLLRQTVSFFA